MKTIIHLASLLATAAIASSTVVRTPSSEPGTFELLILHNNDMHARFEQTSQLSGACTTADREAGKCYGGFPRVAHVVKEARRAAASGEGPPVLYLNAGDTYTGTAWFTIYKWKIAAEFVNALQPDAVSLGNNDLDGPSSLSPFLETIQTTVLSSNVILNSETSKTKLQKSIIFDIEGRKVGLVGYLTPDANILENIKNIEYIDEILALKEEVVRLQKENVTIIIALGHSNIDKDIEIAKAVDGIDLIISGQKDTFYWDGKTKDTEPQNAIVVTQPSGKQVPVIKSRGYSKYLGKVLIKFNSKDQDRVIEDSLITLDESVAQDSESIELLNKVMIKVSARSDEIIGQTRVVLDGESCRTEECNLGNLITDAMMYMYALRYEGERWSDAPIAVIPGGAVAVSIAPSNRPASVTMGDLLAALPRESNIVAVTMNGTVLNQVLEQSVASYSVNNKSESFLQFSGIRVIYDMEKEVGARLLSAVARCWDCFVPQFFTIDDFRTYKILMPAAMADGEYGYGMLVGLPRDVLTEDEVTSTADYIRLRSPVYPEVAGRIQVTNFDINTDNSAPVIKSTFVLVIVALVHFLF